AVRRPWRAARRSAEGGPPLARAPGHRSGRHRGRSRAPGGAGRAPDRVRARAFLGDGSPHRPSFLRRAAARSRAARPSGHLALNPRGPVMPHHSRLSTFVLDCNTDDLAPHVEFWRQALGKRVDTLDEDGDGKYARLHTEDDEPILLLQKVAHPPRIHLDIEADDVDAEVERLVALGARKIEAVRTWV